MLHLEFSIKNSVFKIYWCKCKDDIIISKFNIYDSILASQLIKLCNINVKA